MIKSLICFFVILAGTACAAFAQTKMGDMEFDTIALDMGTFSRDSSVRHATFVFRNTGKKKLMLYAANPDCPCVSVQLPRKPIRPGAAGKIAVTYDGRNKRIGGMHHYIYLAVSSVPNNFRIAITGQMTE